MRYIIAVRLIVILENQMKTNKGNTWIVVLVVVVLALGAWLIYGRSQSVDTNPPAAVTDNTTATGKVAFSITDAAANMGNVTAIDMTVSKVELHSATDGWVTASSDVNKFSLLTLKASGTSQLAASVDVKAGTYDQVRVTVGSVTVTTEDGKVNTAKVPSGEFKFMSNVVVTGGASSSVNMDFLADASLHVTGTGQYIFAPVVKVEVRSNADIQVGGDVVTVKDGTVDDDSTFGMNANGEVKKDFRIDTKAKLDIDVGGGIKVNGVIVPIPVETQRVGGDAEGDVKVQVGGVPGGPAGTSLEQNSPSGKGE